MVDSENGSAPVIWTNKSAFECMLSTLGYEILTLFVTTHTNVRQNSDHHILPGLYVQNHHHSRRDGSLKKGEQYMWKLELYSFCIISGDMYHYGKNPGASPLTTSMTSRQFVHHFFQALNNENLTLLVIYYEINQRQLDSTNKGPAMQRSFQYHTYVFVLTKWKID